MTILIKPIFIIALFLSASYAFAEAKVEMINDSVPNNWILVYYALGDINQDGQEDAIMVIENTDKRYLSRNRRVGPTILNMNPRKMLVLFQTPTGYQEVLNVANGFPTQHSMEKPCLADPLVEAGEINIMDGIVKVILNYQLNCSGYDTTQHTFSFRYENERFRLTGFDKRALERISGNATEEHFDYVLGQQTIVTGINIYEQHKKTTRLEKLLINKVLYLDEMSLACEPHQQARCHSVMAATQ